MQGPTGYHLSCKHWHDSKTNMVPFTWHVMSVMAINKQNVHYTNVHFISLQVIRWHGTWNRVTERTHWLVLFNTLPTSVPQSGLLLRVWCRPSSLQRLTFSMLAGIKAHLPHMPLFLFELHIRHQKWDTVVMSSHYPRYTGSYQTPTGPG